jgi:hypothetical protein
MPLTVCARVEAKRTTLVESRPSGRRRAEPFGDRFLIRRDGGEHFRSEYTRNLCGNMSDAACSSMYR